MNVLSSLAFGGDKGIRKLRRAVRDVDPPCRRIGCGFVAAVVALSFYIARTEACLLYTSPSPRDS